MDLKALQKWFRSEAGQQVLAQVEQAESTDREKLVAEYAAARDEAGQIHKQSSAREAAAQAKVDKAQEALTTAKQSLQDARREGLAARLPVEQRQSRIENELRQMLPDYAAAAMERLGDKVEKMRVDGDDRDTFRTLHALRIELLNASLHLLPAVELDAAVSRIDAAINQRSEAMAFA